MLNNDDTKDLILINKENTEFLRGLTKVLTPEQEIILNINRQLRLTTLTSSEDRGKAMIFCLVSGLVLAILSVATLYFAFLLFIDGVAVNFAPEGLIMAVLCIFPSGTIMALVSYGTFVTLRKLMKYDPEIPFKTYQELIEHGVILTGEISNVSRLRSLELEVKYSFLTQAEKRLRGTYIANPVYRELKQGGKVAVLYLNEKLHILL